MAGGQRSRHQSKSVGQVACPPLGVLVPYTDEELRFQLGLGLAVSQGVYFLDQ